MSLYHEWSRQHFFDNMVLDSLKWSICLKSRLNPEPLKSNNGHFHLILGFHFFESISLFFQQNVYMVVEMNMFYRKKKRL